MPSIRPFVTKHLSNRNIATVFSLVIAICATGAVRAEEPFAEFVEGLRQRGFHNTALEYLDELSKRTDLPIEFAQTLDLERGITYRAQASASRIAEDREQALSQAEIALKAFTKRHNDHPRAPFANSELGQLLFERARSLLWDSEAPSNANRKAELQQQARTLIDQAKGIYQTAHDQYKKQYDEYPKFIDQEEDPEAFQQRLSAEVKYLRAWFNLTRCTYERGQTFDKGSKERKETLTTAADLFEAIHSARRTNPIGLQSRLMMGKCYQEQDDIGRALGIYQEILSSPSKNPFFQLLRSIALQYRLICLNDETKNDFQLVLQEADTWLKDKENRQRLHTEVGLGILWEKAIAGEKMGLDRTVEAAEKTSYQRQALADAKNVGRFPGPYREAAVAMTRRLNAELGDKDAEPKDFDTAFERASGLLTQREALKADLSAAKTGAEKQKSRQAMERQMNEIGRLLELALSLREDDTDVKAAAQARYLLSYAYYSQRKSFDAIVLARYCMAKDKLNNPDAALSSTEIAIAAAIQAFNDAGEDQTFELNLLQEICNLIISQYPQSSKGNEARFRLGQVYRDLNEPLKAAETYLTVPQDYSEYASSRIQAGQSYWLSWVKTMAANEQQSDEPKTEAATLDSWKAEATKQLQTGIKLSRDKLGKDAAPTPEIIAAEVSLATILNMDGKYAETIKNLTAGGANSVLKAMDVEPGQARPDKGIQSSAFAGQAYRLLLRAYVGTQDIDAALKTMAQLQAVGGQDLTAVYTQLGRELQEELERLTASGDNERLAQVRASFEQFLGKVYETRDKKDYNSLLWIGETYFGLGQGVKEDKAAAAGYYKNASDAYAEILSGNLADAKSVPAIQLRQVRCKRAQGQYEEAIQIAEQVLTANPMSIDVQFEAAYALSDWGADPTVGQPDKLLKSIEGLKNAAGENSIWGWQRLTTRLGARQSTPEWETLKERFLEARYEFIRSRLRYGNLGGPGADEQLKAAQSETTMFALVSPDLDDAWFAKFDTLYRDIQTARGEAPKPLERPEVVVIPPEELAPPVEEETKPSATAEPEPTNVPPPEGPNILFMSLALVLLAGGGFAVFKMFSKPQKRTRSTFAPAESFTPPGGGSGGIVPAADSVPDFSGLGAVKAPTPGPGLAAAPARKKTTPPGTRPTKKPSTPEEAAAMQLARKKAAARAAAAANAGKAAAKPASAGQQPVKKKRVLTPEEAVRYRAAKAAREKAAAAAAAAGQAAPPTGAPQKKAVKKAPPGTQPPDAAQQAARRKLVKKRPPQPPAE